MAKMAKKEKSRPAGPCVVSLHGPGVRLRLEVDRRTCLELAVMIATIANDASEQLAPISAVISPSSELSPEEQHAFNHRHAPEALRGLYKTLCDDLLGDAQQALDEEKRRRTNAS
jgi:hypothetical protein